MTSLLPELAVLPARGVFDGEIVAFSDGVPHFPLVCERLVHGDRSIPLTFVVFDVLDLDGETVMWVPYAQRRALLEDLALGGGPWFVAEAFADGAALFAAACRLDPRVSSRSGAWSAIALASTAGSRSRTGTTGATPPRSSRCGRASSGGTASAEATAIEIGPRRCTVSGVRLLLPSVGLTGAYASQAEAPGAPPRWLPAL
jgi:hypothetical protein